MEPIGAPRRRSPVGVDASTSRPFRGSEAVARGEVTWDRLAGPAFLKLLTDVYVGSRAEVDTGTWVRAVALWGRSEARLRLVFVLRGMPAPVPQYGVRVRGGGRRWLDLAWPKVPPGRRKLGLEYDGPEHRTITGQNRDLLRDADLDDEEWEIMHVGAVQVFDERRADQLAARVMRKIT